ncbi:MAG: hypothetical protein K9N35_03150 [Candidatus Marinimicrobia bacterium]|nr:hypothetical protein [Candidatus Neomarinimicrobiota bacterium]
MSRFLTINRLAFLFLIALLILSVNIALFPSIVDVGSLEQIGVTLGLLTIIMLSLSLFRRIRSELKRSKAAKTGFKHSPKIFALYSPFRSQQVEEIITEHMTNVRSFNRRYLFHTGMTYSNLNVGIWGSFIFHFALLIILIALFMNMALGHKMVFSLTEGETFDSPTQSWQHSDPGWFVTPGTRESFSVSLSSFIPPVLYKDQVVTPGSATVFSPKTHTEKTIIYGEGGHIDDYGFILMNWGYSPGLRILDDTGQQLAGYIRIANRWTNGTRIHSDHFTLPNGVVLNLKIEDQNKLQISIQEPKGPNTMTASLSLFPGASGFLQGLQIFYSDIRTWNQFELQTNPGQIPLQMGLISMIIGLLLRALFSRTTIMISIDELKHYTSIKISSKAEKYRASMHKEIQDLLSELEPLLNPLITLSPQTDPIHTEESEQKHAII